MSGDKTHNERRSSFHDEKGSVLKRKLARGSVACSSGILKLRSLKSLETYILLVIFAPSKLMRRATKLHEKGTVSDSLKSGGVINLPPMPPWFLRPYTIVSVVGYAIR